MKGLRGLSYLKHQEDRLKQFLNEHAGMKVLIQVEVLTTDGVKDDEGNHVKAVVKFKSRRFEVLNTDDITYVMTKMAKDIQTQIENPHLNSPDIVIDKINKVIINHDKYNPTRAGS